MTSAIGRLTKIAFIGIYPIVLIAFLWHMFALSGLLPARLFPDIWAIGAAAREFVVSGDFWYHSQFTLYRAFCAFALAAPTGVIIGITLARIKWAEVLFEPLFTFSYPMPKVALFPVFVLIFGFGSPSKIALAFLEALYPIVISTYLGVHLTKRSYIWGAESMGASQFRIFFRVLLPSALAEILTSFRVALHVAFVVVVLLEIIGGGTGLGYYVTYKGASYNYAGLFAGILGIMFWGFLLDRLMVELRARVVFWAPVKDRAV